MTDIATKSIQTKIVVAISLIFVAVLATSTLLTARNERALAQDIALDKARVMSQSYFDGINTLMLTGTMDQHEAFRKKMLSVPGVLELRVAHAPGVLDGVTTHPVKPQDALDERQSRVNR